jgi:PAS domain S-box-containing protein
MKIFSILFVDDDPFILASTSHDLSKKGYRVITAESGEKAISMITDERFDLVITDLIMEPIDGLTVLKRAKQLSPETIVIILTGYADVPSAVEAFRLGADDYLIKPCDIEELNYRVNRCLKHLEDKKRRRKAEKAAREKEEQYKQLLNLMPDAVVVLGDDLIPRFANRKFREMFGYPVDELMNLGPFALIQKKDEERVKRRLEDRFMGRESARKYELVDLVGKNGRSITCEVSGALIRYDGKPADLVIMRDITSRKKAEETLRESEEKYRILVENVGAAVVYFDRDFRLVLANSRVCKDMKMDMETLKGKSLYDFFEKMQAEQFVERWTDIARSGMGADFEDLIDITGKERWMHSRTEPVKNTRGEHIGFVDIISDITERKEAEKALKESEERYRQLADLLPQIVFETDTTGNLTFVNHIAFEIFGFTEGDLEKGLSAFELIIPENRDMARSNMQRILGGERLPGIEYTIQTKDERTYPAMIYTNPIMKEAKPVGLRGIVADLSEVKRAQEALRETEERLARLSKMESLGLMAGGIAHDLNNILSGIVSYPELLLMDLPEDSPLVKPIMTIQESGLRAAEVVSDLLTIARGVAVGKEFRNLNTIVKEYIASVEHRKIAAIYPSIVFKLQLDPDVLNIHCSQIHIKKGLMNLVNNASEATNGNGTVTISTMNRYLDEPQKGYEDMPSGEYAVLSVSDDGTGISQEDIGRIFEPFYTRKVMGRSGTGLGLTVVWNSVQNHGGFINVKSGNGGTLFELYFPATRAEVNAEERRVSQESYLGHGEKILVVDDEERQREIACGLLSRLGYTVEAVPSGEQAVEYLSNHAVDLVVLDMIMPRGMNGRKTYEQIIKVHPHQKAVIISGFSETEDVNAIQKLGAGRYIKKPYTMEKIGIAVKEELARQ